MAVDAVDELQAEVAARSAGKPKSKTKLVVISVFVLVLLAGAGAAGYLFLGAGTEEGGSAQQTDAELGDTKAPPVYFALEPAITVNFQRGGRTRFLQVSVNVMARDPAAIEQLQQHMPVVRNNLNLLFSGQEYEILSTREGKEALRQATLSEIQQVLTERAGTPGIEEVYFTAFVMQ